MPNKTIYVSDDDLVLYARAQELSVSNLSATITTALKRYVEVQEGRRDGFEEITVKVGPGAGRKVRFTGVLLGEWARSTGKTVEMYKVFRSQKGRFVAHTERSPDYVLTAGEQPWGSNQGDAGLEVADTVDGLREKIPPELYELIASVAEQPPVEDLDI
jgi:EXLDI family protein